ncbi:MAG: ABC transporter ATP-binding protein, partial [Ruminococcus sp.]|nr:ABC transporter ATP-binding protein [Ruminococcus sp.]
EFLMLETKSLNAGYGKKIIVNNADIHINRGEITTLIGSNGSGKSTLLKTISSQLEKISGNIYIQDKDISLYQRNELARTVSLMLTGKTEPELMTCLELVESGRYPYTGTLGILSAEDKKKALDAIKLVGGEDIADNDINKTSDGQRQKIMLARAICQETDIMILDEPTSFLDIKHKLELLNILKNLVREKNTTVIMSLHELDLAQKISDKIICVKNNKIDRIGTPEEIFSGDYINKLYDIKCGSYNDIYGFSELEKISGTPEIFVISGNCTELCRKLQRDGIPFAAGVIQENDAEYPVISALASVTVTEKAYEPISPEKLQLAKDIIKNCREVVCNCKTFGTANRGNLELLEFAEKNNKLKK